MVDFCYNFLKKYKPELIKHLNVWRKRDGSPSWPLPVW
jgi:hypothetical protein